VAAVIDCFESQPRHSGESFITSQEADPQQNLIDNALRNAEIKLDDETLLKNINKVQMRQRLPLTTRINKANNIPINLDIEMETGTGKTYCYTKTIFEMHERYGWSKFIIIVPSVAIREGVYFSIKSTEEHFLSQYGKRLNAFLYNSDRLSELRNFESSNDLTVMIMNYQAFTAPPKEGKTTTKTQRKIYGTPDDFQSRRPIDIIASAKAILILDEPQRLEGEATAKALPDIQGRPWRNTHLCQNNRQSLTL
jgi:type III restriction enzyme